MEAQQRAAAAAAAAEQQAAAADAELAGRLGSMQGSQAELLQTFGLAAVSLSRNAAERVRAALCTAGPPARRRRSCRRAEHARPPALCVPHRALAVS